MKSPHRQEPFAPSRGSRRRGKNASIENAEKQADAHAEIAALEAELWVAKFAAKRKRPRHSLTVHLMWTTEIRRLELEIEALRGKAAIGVSAKLSDGLGENL